MFTVTWHENGFGLDSLGRRVFEDEAEAAKFISYDLPRRPNYVGDATVTVQEGEEGDAAEVDLMRLAKRELLSLAQERGLDVDDSMTKAQIVEAMEEGENG